MKTYVPLGDIITINGVVYKCSLVENESDTCRSCGFYSDAVVCNSMNCMKANRPDNKCVIFKKND